jgi:hypothetical protein
VLIGAGALAWWLSRRPVRRASAARDAAGGGAEAGVDSILVAQLRQERAADRRRVRRAHRIARRAARLLAMARCLAGASLAELAVRGTRAIVDNFAAETAALWIFDDGRTVLSGSAARPEARPVAASWPGSAGDELPPRAERGGSVHYLVLHNETREPVGCLVVGFDPPRGRRPPGLDTYAAFLGPCVAAALGPRALRPARGRTDDRAA